MNQAQALKNLMENGTSIEYFNNGYIMQVKDKIKVYEEGKKSARTLTQAQQTKLLLEARGGGQTKPKHVAKRQVTYDDDDVDDETSLNDRKFQQTEQLYSDEEEITIEKSAETPRQTPKPTPKKIIKKPQINYTSPQVDLEELIRLLWMINQRRLLYISRYCIDNIFQPHNTGAPIRFYLQHTLENPQPPIPYSVIPYNQFETVIISI
ncbi:MAG: hypothetical protein EZS28_010954 [Streblomastix strix]|uniref:Uncharacterized protein n=1 Tax=Streblomastix strix TaxID=222440 RepID=A0A5J4WF32_9EUKA|nr:MAG: hypothetical protein EZS28_010954 [Streblomastix strix]